MIEGRNLLPFARSAQAPVTHLTPQTCLIFPTPGSVLSYTVATLRIAYLVNQYPGPSHSFIRREIVALEEQGVEILRFTVRRPKANLPDEADVAELSRTRAILEAGGA